MYIALPDELKLLFKFMCPISPNFLYVGMLMAAVAFSFYLGSRQVSNPYENRRVWRDAKAGNLWAKICVIVSVLFGVLLLAFFGCLAWTTL